VLAMLLVRYTTLEVAGIRCSARPDGRLFLLEVRASTGGDQARLAGSQPRSAIAATTEPSR